MTVVHTHFYIVVDTQRGCHTLKLDSTVGDSDLWCVCAIGIYQTYLCVSKLNT